MTKRNRGVIKRVRQEQKQKFAVGYVRVSTARQVTEGQSLTQQSEAILRWCDANGFTNIGTFSDAGVSGKKLTTRPGVQAAINAACKHDATLVTYSLSRVSRSIDDLRSVVHRLEKCGAGFVSLRESFEPKSASGKLMLNILAALGEFEREITSERTSDALALKIERGERVSRFARYGFKHEDGKLVPEPAEQKVIELIKRLRAKPMTFAQISAELARRNVRNRAGKTKWNPSTILYVLKNAAVTYTGVSTSATK
ncbi:MAG: recombinase family protein [Acidobacteriota bacterium]|mgnify:CR=1 FL=1